MSSAVTLIDTSSWIEALRVSGDKEVRERVRSLMLDGFAAWCDMVAVELWHGARGDYEKKVLAEMEKEITCLPTTGGVWRLARDLARRCRTEGRTVPAADLVIASCAFFHDVRIEHCDGNLDFILSVRKPKRLGAGRV